MANKHK